MLSVFSALHYSLLNWVSSANEQIVVILMSALSLVSMIAISFRVIKWFANISGVGHFYLRSSNSEKSPDIFVGDQL